MTESKLRIFSPVITPRLEYVAGVLFGTISGVDYEFVSDLAAAPHIIYADLSDDRALCIRPAGLVSSSGVTAVEPGVVWSEGVPLLFSTDVRGFFAFDIFSAAFYMLSRYEEYLPFRPDVHGRFRGATSLACREGFLRMPVVDLWAMMLERELKNRFPELQLIKPQYSAMVTIDVDQAYAFKGRGLLRSIGGFVRDLSDSERMSGGRLKTLAGLAGDPFDMFGYMEEKISEAGADARFFFPVGNQGYHDHNTSHTDDSYRKLIQRMMSVYGGGLHSSYRSSGRPEVLAVEKERFSDITGEAPARCRQHWLLLHMPSTYRYFLDAGITEDYSMGYADEPGFRAGIARPYRFYDVEREQTTGLTVVPFQFMDGTLRQYKNMNPDTALKEIGELIDLTRVAGGMFVSIWHNTSVTEMNGWEGWRHVFEETLRMQKV